MSKLREEYTTVDGISVFSMVTAEPVAGDAPTIVLLHGLAVSSYHMKPLAEVLAPNYRVYVPDLPGYGNSDKPDAVLELPELADVLCRWMDAVGIERATLLGNSFGCQVLVEFAVRHGDRLERAILQGPTTDRHTRTFPQQLWGFILDAPNEHPSLGLLQIYDYWRAGGLRLVRTIQMSLEDRLEAKLPQIQVPTLVVRGTKDTLVPQYWVEEVQKLLPYGRLVVIPGGHALNYSAPLELACVVEDFLKAPELDLMNRENV